MILVLLGCASEVDPIRPNVLLVSMDTVRYDRTSLAGSKDTTPNLRALASEGVSWSSAYAVGNESVYSHAAVVTGRYPSEIAIPDYASFALPDDVPTLAGVLGSYGYATGAFTGGGHVVATFGFDKGFDTFVAAPGATRFGSFFESVPSALAWIRGQEGPWFAFVHGYDAHSPYVQRGPFLHPWGTEGATPWLESLLADPLAVEQLRGHRWYPDRTPRDFTHAAGRDILGTDFYALPDTPREGERTLELGEAQMAHVRNHYDSGVMVADFWLGVLLSHVNLETTLVIVMSDHGEDVLDHGFMNHRAGLWDSTLHVPLVAAGPGFEPEVPRAGLVDLRSVLPTVLRAAGAKLPAGVTAPSLQDLGRDDQAVESGMVFAEGVMDTVSVRSGEARLTFTAAKLADGSPGLAQRALDEGAQFYVDDQPVAFDERAEVLRQALVDWRAGLRLATVPGAPIPEAMREEMRARGYWTPGAEPGAEPGAGR